MGNYPIKSVAFGGFDKQDVIQYIEQAAEKASAAEKALQADNVALQQQITVLRDENASLQLRLDDLTAQYQHLEHSLARETAAREALEPLKPLEEQVSRLQAECDTLRPDSQAYAQFRERIGTIECEARKRAADLEASTLSQLQKTVDLFRSQYQLLMSTFESTASHVNNELRKVEVNLAQLPRAMDQAGSELNQLAAQLKQDDHE